MSFGVCKEMGFSQVTIECDSSLVVSWLKNQRCTAWYLWDFWDELMFAFNGLHFTIVHQFREGNSSADFLARMGVEGLNRRFTTIDSLPLKLKGMIRLDKIGLPSNCFKKIGMFRLVYLFSLLYRGFYFFGFDA